MLHKIEAGDWFVYVECNSYNDEPDTRTRLLPWGMGYVASNGGTTTQKEHQCIQCQKITQAKKLNKNLQTMPCVTTESNHLIGSKEIAVILNLPVRQIQRLVKRNLLPPPVPHNKNLLWIKEDFYKWWNDENNRQSYLE